MNIITVDDAGPVKPVFFTQYDFAGNHTNCAGDYRGRKGFKDGIRLIAGDEDNRPFLYWRREIRKPYFTAFHSQSSGVSVSGASGIKASDSAPDGGNLRYPVLYCRALSASILDCMSLFIASRMTALRDNLNCFWKPHSSLKDSAGRLTANLCECVCIITSLWLCRIRSYAHQTASGNTLIIL